MPNPPPAANPALALAVYSWPQWRGVAEAQCYLSAKVAEGLKAPGIRNLRTA